MDSTTVEKIVYSEHVQEWIDSYPTRSQGDERFAAQKSSVVNTLKCMLHILPAINRPGLYDDHELGEMQE